MKKIISILMLVSALVLTGCATVPMASDAQDIQAKQFNSPNKKISGLYIYRDGSILGAGLKKNLYIDDKFIGESARNIYFYKTVKPGKHKISTESEFGNNDLYITTQGGKNYFIRQYIRMGVFVGGANLEQVEEEKAKAAIRKLKMAKSQ
ncbi:DUF2846 domain-containing protein [Gallibacterium anatis]|uniref:Putative lipoprotein n=2 Tax=Gallibacterium anatis TaxID=750 RepID=F4HCW6_GALAU|nr:DUF2846 domain-containing protein [Gallibacterium anatis]AEC16584.1 putative lipoprotein [Gallibacterium anatis UMN179]KGQ41805.1 hypothetical protein JP29_12370 [Gallibacterium anatis]KGQ57322.1 hypothetical protein IO45_11250 [Gallibacterium anatis]KGQ60264.1 hypothetical protein IO43_11990 [Gallibacterium anatis 7990]KGQ67772.1 hypothetical protein IO47_08420 [Gallibacterium anatis]